MNSTSGLSIPISWHESLDSTQTYATSLWRDGRKPPFAVVAATQASGRGRRGHVWESPRGNLYLTLVLPPPAGDVAALTWQPLAAAVAAARAIERTLGLTVTVKWPNDLLFQGAKLGGLICEASLLGDAAGPLVVGIGINVNAMPALPPNAPRALPPTTLAQCKGKSLDLEEFTAAFVQAFGDVWPTLTPEKLAPAFAALATVDGQPWVAWDDERTLCRADGLGAQGELLLAPLGAGEPERLTSVEHRYTWAYGASHRARMPLVVADVGNSRVKLAYYRASTDAKPLAMAAWRHEELRGEDRPLEPLLAAWRQQGLPAHWPMFVLSVNAPAAAHLKNVAAPLGLWAAALRKQAVHVHLANYPLAHLGADRLAAMEAAYARVGGACVVASAGTATTIDLVDAAGVHQGGMILPGLEMAVTALHQKTAALPLVTLPRDGEPWPERGFDTRAAMLAGALQMTLGAIGRMQTWLASKGDGAPVRVIVTGGGAAAITAHIEAEAVPDLILDGARRMCLGGI